MDDEVSSCCCCSSSSTSSSSSRHQFLNAPPSFADRFRDIPEPFRGLIIKASTAAMRQQLERATISCINNPRSVEGIESMEHAVLAADIVGLQEATEYNAMLQQFMAEEKSRLSKEFEYTEARAKRLLKMKEERDLSKRCRI